MSNFLIVSHSQLLRGNVALRHPQCDKGNLNVCVFLEMFHTVLHATKGHTYMSFTVRLTTSQFFPSCKSTLTIATRVSEVPHIAVLISAKHGHTDCQKGALLELLVPTF